MKTFFFILAICIANILSAQSILICNGKPLQKVRTILYVGGIEQKGLINFHKIHEPYTLELTDPSYKIVGFRLVLPSLSKNDASEILVKEYTGNRIEANDKFLNSLTHSDILSFGCITVEKNKIRYMLLPIFFEVVE